MLRSACSDDYLQRERRVGSTLASRGADDITIVCALAAPEGLWRLERSGLPLHVVTASIDQGLNEDAFIVPGLGDAGDRQFGPR